MALEETTVQAQIGRHMRACRALAGLSQVAASEAVDVPQREISRLETGKFHAVNPVTLLRLAEVYGVSLDQLMGKEGVL